MATQTKLKIGLILDTSLDPNDGVQQYVVHVGEWLRHAGHDVHYLVGETKKRDLPNLHSLSHNISVSFNGNKTTIPLPTSGRKLRRFIKKHNFDVLHVQSPHHPLMAQKLILAAGPTTAVVGTFHILPYGRLAAVGSKLLGIWLRPSIKRIDQMLAVSPAAATFCQSSYGISAQILPNVVDYNLYKNAEPLPDYDDNILTILFLGRLVPRKGCQVLLQAVALLAKDKSLPPFRVLVCGSGPLKANLEQYVSSSGLDKLVTFTGFVAEADKPRYYASADIAVFPAKSGESFGIVLIEALSAGRAAVLGGDNPGYRSVLEPMPGLLFPPDDAEALASKLSSYLSDQKLRQQMAEWGGTYARSFDVSVVGHQLLGFYDQALRKRRKQ